MAVVLGLLVCWEITGRSGLLDPDVAPSPLKVLGAAGDLIGEGTTWTGLGQTGRSILLAFVIGSLLGIAVGAVLGLSRLLRGAYMTPLLFIMSTPKSIFLPIFILLYGIGGTSAVAFGAFEATVFVAVNIAVGMTLVQERHRRMAAAFAASRRQTLQLIVLPSVTPAIFTSLWFGIKHAFTGVMIAELWASSVGVGALIRVYSERAEIDRVFALIIALTVLAVAAGALWNRAELRLTRWRGGRNDSGDLLAPS